VLSFSIKSENVIKYAQKKGLFVIEQTGDSAAIAVMPRLADVVWSML